MAALGGDAMRTGLLAQSGGAVVPEVGAPTPQGMMAVWDVVCGAAELAASMAVAGDEGWRQVQFEVVSPYYCRARELEDQLLNRQARRLSMGLPA